MRSYRAAFFAVLIVAIGLGMALVWRWRAAGPGAAAATAPSSVVAAGPPAGAAGAAIPSSAGGAAAAGALAPVRLSARQQQAIGVTVGTVAKGPVSDPIHTVGTVAPDQRLLATVQVRFAGWVQREYANEQYQFIRRGQPLLTIYSPQLVTAEREYLLARQQRELLRASAVPGVAAGAETLLAASRQRLAQWQVPAAEVARLARTGRVRHSITIDSPATGYVLERQVLPNGYVQPGTTLYTIAGLSKVWVNAAVQQTDAGRVRAGEPATITVDAYPGRVFPGQVDFVNPVLNAATRTLAVRLVFANPELRLKPGMFVNATIQVPLGRRLSVPAGAVLETGRQAVVFVAQGQGYFNPTTVTVGARVGDRLVILKGLRAGERIATSANFLIDSESQLQAALGAYAPPPPGVGANSVPPGDGPSQSSGYRLALAPMAWRKGNNRVRLRLLSAAGAGAAGAQVQMSLRMPAMPAMGMAAQQARANLRDEGGGNYAGTVTLPSGGAWQLRVTAERNGAVLAQYAAAVRVPGGA